VSGVGLVTYFGCSGNSPRNSNILILSALYSQLN
jgi:hypothetical protein